MRRKIIKQGHNTLTITLPAKWVSDNSIKAGEEIEIDESDKKCLRILPSSHHNPEEKSIQIDVSGLDHNTIRQKLRSAYKLGYEEIALTFENSMVKELRTDKDFPIMELINHEISNLIGCEIIKQSDNSCLIKDYAVDSELEFDNTLRRVFILIVDYGQSLVEQIKKGDIQSLKGMRERHFNIAKFIFYCQRLINKGAVQDNRNATFLYYIVSELDEILDIMKYAAADWIEYNKKNIDKEMITILTKIIEQNKNFYEFYYKPTANNLKTLVDNRWYVRKKIKNLIHKLQKEDLFILKDTSFILELYYHLSEARMSLDYTPKHS